MQRKFSYTFGSQLTNMQIMRTLFVMCVTSVHMAIDYFDGIF